MSISIFFLTMLPKVWIIAIILIHLTCIEALNNGLALTPPMGWMHWQRFRCLTDCEAYPDECISENLFRITADHLASDGYLDAGYEYLIIDDCWMSNERDAEGRLQPNATRFPNGIKALADYVHSKGLKFGIYADYGTKTCAGYPGSHDYLEIDAKTFAEWEVDYLKLDGCYANLDDLEPGYIKMGNYLNRTGRPIVYSCSWPAYQEPKDIKPNYTALQDACNLWRNWDDIDDSWSNVTNILKWFSTNQDRIQPFSGVGHWNDPDMLIIGNYGLSYEQSKAQMAIWAIMAAPLIMSVDLRLIEPKFKEILLNEEIIKINQDPLGIQGRLVESIKNIDIWLKPILPKDDNGRVSYAIGILSNRVDGYPFRLNVTLSYLNITEASQYSVKDIYKGTTVSITPQEVFWVRVKPSGVVLLTASPTPSST